MARGWVDRDHVGDILADSGQKSSSSKVTFIVGLLGAVLLAAGVLLFVSANWQEMSKLGRVLLLMAAMWSTFAVGVWLYRTSHDYLLEAVLLLGAAVFGGNIMLVAQIYHIEGHYPDAFFLWGAGALLVAVLLASRAALTLAFLALIWWAGAEIIQFDHKVFWPFLPIWAIAAATAYWLAFRPGIHLAFLSFMAWFFASLEQLVEFTGLNEGEVGVLFVLLMLAGFVHGLVIARKNPPWSLGFGGALAKYCLSVFLVLAFVLQYENVKSALLPGPLALILIVVLGIAVLAGALFALSGKIFSVSDVVLFGSFTLWFGVLWFVQALIHVWIMVGVVLGLSIWLLSLGQRLNDRVMVWMALFAFGCDVIYLYVETLGSLLDTSVFFLVGGILLIGLAFGLETLRRFLGKRRKGDEVAI